MRISDWSSDVCSSDLAGTQVDSTQGRQLEGCSLPTLRDIDRLLDGVDLSKVDTAWHWAALAYPMVASVHVKRGQPLETLQGSNMPDMLQQTLCGWGQVLMPTDLCHPTTVDEIEFSRSEGRRVGKKCVCTFTS